MAGGFLDRQPGAHPLSHWSDVNRTVAAALRLMRQRPDRPRIASIDGHLTSRGVVVAIFPGPGL